jgi:hypothetical protein
MTMRRLLLLGGLLAAIALIATGLKLLSGDDSTCSAGLVVTSPREGATVMSPFTVSSEARGGWYSEGSFPVRLEDASGRVLAEVPAQAQGEWMTADTVPFLAELTFAVAERTQAT